MSANGATATTLSSPYQPDQKLTIHAHTPPHPYGRDYKNRETIRKPICGLVDWDGQHKLDHLTFVLGNPPVDTAPPAVPKSHSLLIDRIISHKPKKKGGGPFVVSCFLDSDRSCRYVAKIYDGLEYRLADRGDGADDCMYRADMDYSREATAYESIPSRFQGDIVPRYFGSWTFTLPLPVVNGTTIQRRPVRMILIEYIDGESMREAILRAIPSEPTLTVLDYSLLPPEEERLNLLARAIEAETAIMWYAGVRHGDLAPRNIMISRPVHVDAPVRVVLIDFNVAHVLKLSESGRRALALQEPGSLPPSPIQRYWPGSDFTRGCKFDGWIPQSWRVDIDVSQEKALEWLVGQWNGSPDYQPLSGTFFLRLTHFEMSGIGRRCLLILQAEALQAKLEKGTTTCPEAESKKQ
jgi:hypothetical protein